MLKKYKPYIISIAVALSIGGLSALFTNKNMQFYDNLNKPFLAPPKLAFPIVWSILFILMGYSSAKVYIQGRENKIDTKSSLWIYGIQLIINFLWSIIFFNMRKYLFAFFWLLLLLGFITAMIISFKKSSLLASYLQIPYLLWVVFAGYLNFMIYILN